MFKAIWQYNWRQCIPIGSLIVTCIFDIIAGFIFLKEAVEAQHKPQGTADFVCNENLVITIVLAILAAHGLAHFVIGGCDRNTWNIIKNWNSGATPNLILIWCAFAVEFGLLKHSYGKKNEGSNSPGRIITHPEELLGGGIACFVHMTFTVALYFVMRKARKA